MGPPPPPPWNQIKKEGAATLACGLGGLGRPNPDDWTKNLALCVLCWNIQPWPFQCYTTLGPIKYSQTIPLKYYFSFFSFSLPFAFSQIFPTKRLIMSHFIYGAFIECYFSSSARFSFRRISSSIPNTPEACISQNSPSICQEISEYSTYLPRSKKYNYHTFLNLHVQFARLVQLHRFSFYQDTSFGHEPVFSSVIKILTFTRSST